MSPDWKTILSAWGLACLLAACANPEPEPRFEDWVTEVEHRIGHGLGGDVGFGSVAGVRVSNDGHRVHVLDGMSSRVTIWTPEGALLETVGRRGQGPGEFLNPHGIGLLDEGFYVMDGPRLVSFAPDGRVTGVQSVPAAISYRGFHLAPLGMTGDGAIVVYPLIPASVEAGWYGDDPVLEYPLLRVAEGDAGWEVESIAFVDSRNGGLSIRRSDRDVGGYHTMQPYRDDDLAIFDPRSGSVVVVQRRSVGAGALRLTEVSTAGDTLWARTVHLPPIRLEPADIDRFLDAESEQIAAAWRGVSLVSVRRMLSEALYTPRYHPAADIVNVIGAEMWMRTAEGAHGDTLGVWYAVSKGSGEGDSLRRVLLPDYFFPVERSADLLWGVAYDSLDADYVEARCLSRAY